jgi:hypothetical protein
MSRAVQAVVVLMAASLTIFGATVEKMSLDNMIQRSTAIVRGRAVGARTLVRGAVIYTVYQVRVAERWKGPVSSVEEVAVPGGTANRVRQRFIGTPKIQEGAEYVFFLWTGANRITHVIGLSQGVLDLRTDNKGNPTVFRAAAKGHVVDSDGRSVEDAPLSMSLRNLRSRIRLVLGDAK